MSSVVCRVSCAGGVQGHPIFSTPSCPPRQKEHGSFWEGQLKKSDTTEYYYGVYNPYNSSSSTEYYYQLVLLLLLALPQSTY